MTEICVQVFGELEDIKKAVEAKEFEFVETYNNFDTYFTTIKKENVKMTSYKNLMENSVIVRRITGENSDRKYIVYKKKMLDEKGNVVEETKTKLVVDDTEKAKVIFNNLGLCCWCDYVVENNVYKNGEIEVDIQNVGGLGVFFEIEEFESIAKKSEKEKFEILTGIVKSLGFSIGDDFSFKKPYEFLKKNFNKS